VHHCCLERERRVCLLICVFNLSIYSFISFNVSFFLHLEEYV